MLRTRYPSVANLILAILALMSSSCAYKGVNTFPLDPLYPRQDTLLQSLNAISQRQPGLARHRIIGFSDTEHLPLYAIELGRGERQILIIGQHHGDEVLGVGLGTYVAEQMTESYATNKRVKDLLDQFTLWIIPTINPEGWRPVSSGVLKNKRKNNRDTDGNKRLDLRTDGVDLNRNYPVFWDLDGESNPISSYYKGPAPASESEVQSVILLGRQQNFEFAVFYHSSASGALNETIFLPAVDSPDSTFTKLQELADLYAGSVPRDYRPGTYRLHRGSTSKVGNARNFFYHSLGVPAMLIEIGGVDKDGKSIIHPPAKMLKRIQKRHYSAILDLLEKLPPPEL
ncbi:MAG: M14 family metallopeptidase [Candidatus Cloacimonetes bacterium]|nr:M14 family metallopeptidase [Candidatus Cloacimonadota bacterium]